MKHSLVKHSLVIVWNRLLAQAPTTYVEVVEAADGMCALVELKRKPRAARFDEVMETGEGSYNHWNAHRAVRLHGHKLQKT